MKQNAPTITLLFSIIFLCSLQHIHAQVENKQISDIENISMMLESKPCVEQEEDDEFKIVFDLEEIYPLVDYDTICTDYEIQDFIDNKQPVETTLTIHNPVLDDALIPDLPQAPQSIEILTIEDIPVAEEVITVTINEQKIDDLVAKKKNSWFGKKSKRKRNN